MSLGEPHTSTPRRLVGSVPPNEQGVILERVTRGLLAVAVVLTPIVVTPGPRHGFAIPKLVVIAGTCAALAVLTVPHARQGWARAPRLAKVALVLAAAFGAWVLLATLLSDTPRLSTLGPDSRFVGTVAIAFPIVLVAAIPAVVRTVDHLDRLLLVLTGTIGVIATYAVIQTLGLDPAPWAPAFGGRPVATFGNSNFVGAVLATGVPLSLWLWFAPEAWRRWSRPAAGYLLLVTLISLWTAEARLGWVAAASGGLAVAIALVPTPLERVQAWLVSLVPVATPVAGLGVVAVGFLVIEDRTSLARQAYWSAAVPMWQDNALTGVGVGRFQAFHRAYRPESAVMIGGRDATVDSSHAWLLDLAATTGTPGALLWIALLVTVGLLLRQVWLVADRDRRVQQAVVLGLLAAHGMQSSISVPVVATVWLGWLVLGLALAVGMVEKPRVGRGRPRKRSRVATDPRYARRNEAVERRETLTYVAATLAAIFALTPAVQVWFSDLDLGHSTRYRAADDLLEAARVTQQATRRTPWWPAVWDERSSVAMLLAAQPTAIEAGEASLDVDPRNRLGLRQMIRIVSWTEGPEQVTALYDRLQAVDPRGFDTHVAIAEWALDLGDGQRAEEAVEIAAAAVDPSMRQWRRIESLRERLDEG